MWSFVAVALAQPRPPLEERFDIRYEIATRSGSATDAFPGPRDEMCMRGSISACLASGSTEDLRTACAYGSLAACTTLASKLEPDDPERPALLERACDGGHGVACERLGTEIGDPRRAVTLFRAACAAADTPSCWQLGLAIVGRDRAAGLALLERSCTAARPDACPDFAAALDRSGEITARATAALVVGCGAGHVRSCAALGLRELAAGEVELGRDHLETTCLDGALEACDALARGFLDAGDPARARPWLRWSCDHDVPAACADLERLGL